MTSKNDLQDALLPAASFNDGDKSSPTAPTMDLLMSSRVEEEPLTKDDEPLRMSNTVLSHEKQRGSIDAEVKNEMQDDVGDSGPHASLVEVPTVQRPLVDYLGKPLDVDAESLSDTDKYSPSIVQSLSYALVHSMRLYGWLPWLLLALAKYPLESIAGILALYALRVKTSWWNDMVLRFLRYAASPKPRLVRANSVPYDPTKQYMLTLHPHNIMLDGVWNVMSRFAFTDEKGGQFHKNLDAFDGIEVSLCAAPALQFIPLYGEMYRDQAFPANKKNVDHVIKKLKRCPVLVPGGFSEAVYSNYRPNQEVAYLLGRYGFIKIAIENGIDIIPFYTFGAQQMYNTIDAWRHERAVWAQKTGIPMTPFWGQWGTSVPLNDESVTVTFDPFPTSKYTLEEVEKAHADFCVYLKKCFDEHKHVSKYTKDSELLFAGKNQKPARLS